MLTGHGRRLSRDTRMLAGHGRRLATGLTAGLLADAVVTVAPAVLSSRRGVPVGARDAPKARRLRPVFDVADAVVVRVRAPAGRAVDEKRVVVPAEPD